MKVFIQSIYGQILLTAYVAWRGYSVVPARRAWRIPYLLFFILEVGIFLFGYFFRNDLPDAVMLPLMMLCNTWYIASLYLTIGLVFLELLRLGDRFFHWFPAFIRQNMLFVKRVLFVLFIIGDVCLMVHAYRTVMNPVVKHVYLSVPKGSSSRDSLRIVMMSDLHIGEVIQKPLVQKQVSLCNAQHPELVVLVGDIMDYESRWAENAHIEDDLRRLDAPLGVFIVNGNHEYRANIHAKRKWLRKVGTLLIDSVASPDSTFLLIGRDDFVNKKRKALHELITGKDTTLPTIVLDHQPWSFSEMRMLGIDLGLHGHTHNGQLWPYPLVMKFIYECPYGYYRKGPTQHYVSSGVGCAGPPYRVGTLSEIVVLHIKFCP